MTTNRERGRDPEQHVTHAGAAAANNFTGMHGELTFVAEGGSAHAAVIQLRAHNGIDAGGYVVAAVPASEPRAVLPTASVPPAFSAAGEETLISHELGYTPLVQVLDADGYVVPPNSIEVTELEITVAAPASNETNDHVHGIVTFQVPSVTEVVNWTILHHDQENFTFNNFTGEPLTLIIR